MHVGARGARMHAPAPASARRAPRGVFIHGRLVNFGDSHTLWCVMSAGGATRQASRGIIDANGSLALTEAGVIRLPPSLRLVPPAHALLSSVRAMRDSSLPCSCLEFPGRAPFAHPSRRSSVFSVWFPRARGARLEVWFSTNPQQVGVKGVGIGWFCI